MTQKIGYGVFTGGTKFDYDKEAIIAVWNEKNIFKASNLNPGHGAMKLKRRDLADSQGKMTIVDYISWWPTEQAGKDSKKGKGQLSTSSEQDKSSEISALIQMLLFLSALWTEMSDMEEERQFVLKQAWQSLVDDADSEDYVKALTKIGFTEDFANFGEFAGKYTMRGNQQIIKSKKVKFGVMKSQIGFLRDKKKTEPIHQADYGVLLNMAGAQWFGKLPDTKIYVPCSSWVYNCKNAKRNSTVWGLSLQMMYFSWLCFHSDREAQYVMKSTEINCAAAVMVRLKDGHGDAFVKWPGAMGLTRAIRSLVSYVPSDLAKIGTALDKQFKKLNSQQTALDALIVEKKEAVRAAHSTLRASELFWRHLLTFEYWKKASASSTARWTDIGKVDKAVKKYEAANSAMTAKEEKKLLQAILDDVDKLSWFKDEATKYEKDAKSYEDKIALYQKRVANTTIERFRRRFQEKLDAARGDAKGKRAKGMHALRKDQEEMTLAIIRTNFKAVTAYRKKKAIALIELHNEVYKFASKKKKSPRLPAVLLLARVVAAAFYENAQFGRYITKFTASEEDTRAFDYEINVLTSSGAEAIVQPTPEAQRSIKKTILGLSPVKKKSTVTPKPKSDVEMCTEHGFPLYECPMC